MTGYILYTDGYRLLTTYASYAKSSVIAGSSEGYSEGIGTNASFKLIRGFTQVNVTHVIIADTGNHCLRFINRITNETSYFKGICGESGYRDGIDPLFNYPWGVAQNPTDSSQLYVADHHNHAIRMFDIKSDICITIRAKGDLNRPMGLNFDWNKDNLIITNTHFLLSMRIDTLEFQVTVGVSTGADGHNDLTAAESYLNWPRDTIFISESVQLIADHDNQLIRVVDIDSGEVYSLCTGAPTTEDGDISECGLSFPNSLLYLDGYLYVGVDGISRMKST